MARVAVNVTVSTQAAPVHPSVHTVASTAAGAETSGVYVSYDVTKISGYAQLHSALMAALAGLANGNLGAGT